MQRSWLQWILTGKRPTLLTLYMTSNSPDAFPHFCHKVWSMISIWWLFSHCCSWSCIPRDWRKVSQQRSQATLFLSVTNLFVTTSSRPWNLDTFENGSHNKRPRRESENRFWKKTYVKVRVKTDFEKRLMWKWEWKQILKKYFCKSESDECSAETLLPQSRGTPLQLLQQLQLLIKKRKGLHWLVQWTILTIQLWSWLFWERKKYSFVGTT